MRSVQTLACLACAAVAAASLVPAVPNEHQHVLGAEPETTDFKCDLPPVVSPSGDGLPEANEIFGTEAALLKQVKRHSALVKIPTVCYDDLGDFDEDPRWAPYYDFHDALIETFPGFHQRAKREIVNRFGLLYTIEGSDTSLKPLLLTAHFDVVPVADPSTWTYPPFAAHFDGTWLWGRGSSDDKNSLTGLLSAAETLLANASWKPRRTVLLAFGFDEECSGLKGAGAITQVLQARYGTDDAVALVLDEGGSGLQPVGRDALYALPAVSEKGHVDNWFELHVQGGHSSIPFPHTGIGIVAEIIAALEAHPYEPRLVAGGPVHNHFVCQARYSPDAQPEITRLVNKGDLESLAEELVQVDRPTQFRIQTSQAVDMIRGGQKINAMPEVVSLGVNYRVAHHNTIAEIQKNIVRFIQPVVEKYGLTVKAFEGEAVEREVREVLGERAYVAELNDGVRPLYDVDYNGTLVITSKSASAAVPISPTSGPVWDLFSGTIQHSFRFDGGRVIPVGELMTGNTDTRHYLDLTRNVYRWTPTREGGNANTHTINERINMHAHLEAVKFYYDLIRNFDASDV